MNAFDTNATFRRSHQQLPFARVCLTGMSTLLWMMLVVGCEKAERAEGAASVTIVNTLSTPLIVNFNEEDSVVFTNGGVNQVLYSATSLEYALPPGVQWINLHELNTSTTIPTWTREPLSSTRIQLSPGEMWSLFLTGTVDQPDTLLVRDRPLRIPTADSSLGIRFVNLVEGQEVAINLTGQATGSEEASLPYESVTDFRKYAADVTAPNYFFQCRNKTTGALLATAVISNPGTVVGSNMWRYRNFTIVFYGSSSPAAFVVRNY